MLVGTWNIHQQSSCIHISSHIYSLHKSVEFDDPLTQDESCRRRDFSGNQLQAQDNQEKYTQKIHKKPKPTGPNWPVKSAYTKFTTTKKKYTEETHLNRQIVAHHGEMLTWHTQQHRTVLIIFPSITNFTVLALSQFYSMLIHCVS